VVMTSGDNVLTNQAIEFNNNIEAVEVKKAHSRYVGECIQPKKVHKMLELGAEKAIYNKSVIPNILEGEVELEIAFMDSGMAEGTLCIPGVQLIAPNRIKYRAKHILEAYKIRGGLITLAGTWMS